jgi:uncharacterized protein YbjT (DUF2867 family)
VKVLAAEQQVGQRVALVAGGTGLTGAALLQLLLRSHDYVRVHAVTRRPLLQDHARLANHILKFEELGPRLAAVRCHDAFSCIGAAQGPRAQAGDLRHVDLELVLAFARAAQLAGATRLVVVSAAFADRASPRPFQRAKGELEAALRELRFGTLEILQPGSVLGLRTETTAAQYLRMVLRPLLNPLLQGRLAPARAVTGVDLAAAMLGAARSQRRGVFCHTGTALRDLASVGRRSP